MVSAGQHIAVEDAHAIARQRFVPQPGHQAQKLGAALGAVTHHRFADSGRQPAQLAIECCRGSRDGRVVRRLIGLVGGMYGAIGTDRDLDEQPHQGSDGQFAGVVVGSLLLEKQFQGRLVEQPFQRAAHHDAEGYRLSMLDHRDRNVAKRRFQ